MVPSKQPRLDLRYTCSSCDQTSRIVGCLDWLKEGTPKMESLSLQHHVEIIHPDVTDWMSLKVTLPAVQRGPSRRERSTAPTPGITAATVAEVEDTTPDDKEQYLVVDDDTTDIQTNEDKQRGEIAALKISNQKYMSTINEQAALNRSLLNCITNGVEAMTENEELHPLSFWQYLLILSQNDGHLAQYTTGEVVAELKTRRFRRAQS